MKLRALSLIAAAIASLIAVATTARAAVPDPNNQITILYDAFGTDPSMSKDWGFSALVEVAGKRILLEHVYVIEALAWEIALVFHDGAIGRFEISESRAVSGLNALGFGVGNLRFGEPERSV